VYSSPERRRLPRGHDSSSRNGFGGREARGAATAVGGRRGHVRAGELGEREWETARTRAKRSRTAIPGSKGVGASGRSGQKGPCWVVIGVGHDIAAGVLFR